MQTDHKKWYMQYIQCCIRLYHVPSACPWSQRSIMILTHNTTFLLKSIVKHESCSCHTTLFLLNIFTNTKLFRLVLTFYICIDLTLSTMECVKSSYNLNLWVLWNFWFHNFNKPLLLFGKHRQQYTFNKIYSTHYGSVAALSR